MKTVDEIKDEVARTHNYPDWKNIGLVNKGIYVDKVAELYALIQIEKDREKIKKSMSELFFDKDLEYIMEKIKIELD